MAAGPQLGLEAETAVITGGIVDDPRGAPRGGQVVTWSEDAAVDIKVLGQLNRWGRVKLESEIEEIADSLVILHHKGWMPLKTEEMMRGDHAVPNRFQGSLYCCADWLVPVYPSLQSLIELQLALQNEVGALEQGQEQVFTDGAPFSALQHRGQVPGQVLKTAVPQGCVPNL